MNKQNKYTLASTSKSNPYLEYFSQFKEVRTPPKSLSEFSDGVFLLELAQIIRDFTCVGEVVDVPRTFSHKLTHLKVLFKSIERFWSDVLGVEIEGEEIDLVEIGRSGSVEEVEKLLELFVKTAVQAQNKDYFIEKVLRTSQETQQFLKKIIEKVFGSERESPRKEKEKRMYDKILELDHENDKLHSVLQQICDQKLELQQKVRVLNEKLAEKSKELQNYEAILHEDSFTPQKKRVIGMPDTSDRKDSLIDSLKSQVAEMAVQHEKELQALCGEMERLNAKVKEYQKMKNELQLCREIIDSHQQFRAEAQQIENQLSQLKAQGMSKDNHLACLKERQQRCDRLIVDLQTALTTSRGDLQRKNIQINELISKLDDLQRRMSPRKGDPSNLFTDFPGIVNTEAEAYMETNRSLREELERTRRKLEQGQAELERVSAQAENLRGCESENRRLRELVLEYNAYRGQQNQILVSSLYHLRRMVQSRLG